MALLDASGISKHFAGVTALDNVTLSIEAGRTHAIIGPNGAGKSTFINVLTGRLVPDYGTCTFDGESLIGRPPHSINQLGIARVFQTPELYNDMSCLENVTIAGLARRDGSFKFNLFQSPKRLAPERDHAASVLERVGLGRFKEHEARLLSRGDKRRLELAICLVHDPKLLLLDEPTAGMSHHETMSTTELLKDIKGENQTMTKIVIEHDMDVVFALSEQITVFHQGRVIASDTPEGVRNNDDVQEAYLGGAEL